jgi:hypothetical protein
VHCCNAVLAGCIVFRGSAAGGRVGVRILMCCCCMMRLTFTNWAARENDARKHAQVLCKVTMDRHIIIMLCCVLSLLHLNDCWRVCALAQECAGQT